MKITLDTRYVDSDATYTPASAAPAGGGVNAELCHGNHFERTMKYSDFQELLFILFGCIVCRIFGHAQPNDGVKTYHLHNDTREWQCPRCGGGAVEEMWRRDVKRDA